MRGIHFNVISLPPGHDFPLVIEAGDTGTAVQDALTNRLHAALVVCEGDRAGAIEWVRSELDALLIAAAVHFDAEQNRDDLCPAGVEVRGSID